MPGTTPTQDIALSYTQDAATGVITADIPLTPNNDFQTVEGFARLLQDVTRFLITLLGSYPFDITFGNDLFHVIARPSSSDYGEIVAIVQVAEHNFLQMQATAAASGYLTTDEQLDHFEDVSVASAGVPGAFTVSLTVVSRAGQQRRLDVPFSTLTVAA